MDPRPTHRPARPAAVYLLMGLLLLQAAGAIFGGLGLVVDPQGGFLQMPVSALDGSPFRDYLVPGLILLLLLGVFPLITVAGLWFRPAMPWLAGLERRAGFDVAWLASFTVGVALIMWIVVQVLMIGYVSPLQPIFFVVGVAIVGVSLLPSVRNHYRKPGNGMPHRGQRVGSR